MKIKQIVIGLLTYLPFFRNYIWRSTGGTNEARYCYSVWMRHIVLAYNHSLINNYPKKVAELGLGDSLGIGLIALISGVEKYYAFDVVNYASIEKNLIIFDELVNLFINKSPIPDDKEYPKIKPYLENYNFPSHIFTDEFIKKATLPQRLEGIRKSIRENNTNDIINYKVPWYDCSIDSDSLVDMIYSQAVLEHVDDLDSAYLSMNKWLKDDGFISHQIDFKSHGMAKDWNGHWKYSSFTWKILRGKRLYLINRQPLSVHKTLLSKYNFRIVYEQKVTMDSKYSRDRVAKEFQDITDEDLVTSGVFIQVVKR